MSDPKLGEIWKERNKLYRVDLITETFIVLSAVHGDADDGMIVRREDWESVGLKKAEVK